MYLIDHSGQSDRYIHYTNIVYTLPTSQDETIEYIHTTHIHIRVVYIYVCSIHISR